MISERASHLHDVRTNSSINLNPEGDGPHDKELAVIADRVAMVWVEIAKINETRQ